MFFLPLHRPVNERRPFATLGLVAVNVACFFTFMWSARDGRDLEPLWYRFGYVPADPSLPALVTHLFIHAGWEHLAGNMVMLALMGMNVERRLGPAAFLGVYFASGFAAAALFGHFNAALGIPLGGASGAISGVAGMYLALFARREVEVLWYLLVTAGTLRVPAWTFSLLWAGTEVLQAVLLNGKTNVANWAHVGGFAAGLAGVALLRLLGLRPAPETRDDTRRRLAPPPDTYDELAYIPETPEETFDVLPRRHAPARVRIGENLPYLDAQGLAEREEREGRPAFLVPRARRPRTPPLRVAASARLEGRDLVVVDDAGAEHRRDLEQIYLVAAARVVAPAGERVVLDLLATGPWTAFRLPGASAAALAGLQAPASPGFQELAREGRITQAAFPDLRAFDAYVDWLLAVQAGGGLRAESA